MAFKDGYYCFVEVKAREGDAFGLPAEAVDKRKRERYRKIALYFCNMKRQEVPCRFDVASIYKDELEYFENAYMEMCFLPRAPLAYGVFISGMKNSFSVKNSFNV